VTILDQLEGNDGSLPFRGLLQASDGNFYGTTTTGGTSNRGTVFRMTPAGSVTLLHSFDDSDGAYPEAALIQASNGLLYGTTTRGGSFGLGTIFAITTGGALNKLHEFSGADGRWPNSPLVLARNGNFYSLYRRFPEGTPVGEMASGAQLDGLVRLLRSGARALLTPALKLRGGTATILPGTETEVLTLTGGPRQLRWLRFRVPDQAKVALGDARLRIYWDGETTPSVDAPLKYVTGDGAGVYAPRDRPLVASWPTFAGQDGDGFAFELLWPMPFHKSARVTLSAPTDLGALSWQSGDEPFAHPSGWWGTFHATEATPTTVDGADLTFLDVSGSGRIVGTVVNFGKVDPTLDAHPRFHLDHNRTPQAKATGTEEWAIDDPYCRDDHQP